MSQRARLEKDNIKKQKQNLENEISKRESKIEEENKEMTQEILTNEVSQL